MPEGLQPEIVPFVTFEEGLKRLPPETTVSNVLYRSPSSCLMATARMSCSGCIIYAAMQMVRKWNNVHKICSFISRAEHMLRYAHMTVFLSLNHMRNFIIIILATLN